MSLKNYPPYHYIELFFILIIFLILRLLSGITGLVSGSGDRVLLRKHEELGSDSQHSLKSEHGSVSLKLHCEAAETGGSWELAGHPV